MLNFFSKFFTQFYLAYIHNFLFSPGLRVWKDLHPRYHIGLLLPIHSRPSTWSPASSVLLRLFTDGCRIIRWTLAGPGLSWGTRQSPLRAFQPRAQSVNCVVPLTQSWSTAWSLHSILMVWLVNPHCPNAHQAVHPPASSLTLVSYLCAQREVRALLFYYSSQLVPLQSLAGRPGSDQTRFLATSWKGRSDMRDTSLFSF